MKYLVLFILSIVLFSCSDLKKGRQLNELKVVEEAYVQLQKDWNNENIQTIDSLSHACHSKLDSIKLFYNDQELDLETVKKVDRFKQSEEDFKSIKKMNEFFPSLLDEKLKSIQKLTKDVNTGSGRREKYEEYIDFEQRELVALQQQFSDYQATKKRCLENYEGSERAIIQLIDSLKKQSN